MYTSTNIHSNAIHKSQKVGTSLVVQYLGIFHPKQGMQVRSPVGELRSHKLWGAAKKNGYFMLFELHLGFYKMRKNDQCLKNQTTLHR